FQVMVACGMAMMAVALWAAVAAWRCRCLPDGPRFLAVVALSGPLGMVAIEAGWTVTEVGRQPWIVQGVMRTADAVTPVPGLWDLTARGPRAGAQRAVIAHAIGPVWEANHVWLIIVIVLLFTGFPAAFAAIMTALHVPLSLMLVGIVLRGSAFSFRSYDNTEW